MEFSPERHTDIPALHPAPEEGEIGSERLFSQFTSIIQEWARLLPESVITPELLQEVTEKIQEGDILLSTTQENFKGVLSQDNFTTGTPDEVRAGIRQVREAVDEAIDGLIRIFDRSHTGNVLNRYALYASSLERYLQAASVPLEADRTQETKNFRRSLHHNLRNQMFSPEGLPLRGTLNHYAEAVKENLPARYYVFNDVLVEKMLADINVKRDRLNENCIVVSETCISYLKSTVLPDLLRKLDEVDYFAQKLGYLASHQDEVLTVMKNNGSWGQGSEEMKIMFRRRMGNQFQALIDMLG